jgi:tRNA pseudouridine13 synthase
VFELPDWPQSGHAGLRGRYRATPEAFRVVELLDLEAEGAGEHLLCEVEKRGLNSADVAAQLGRIVCIPALDVGFCGAKDRHAVTRQWFSLRDPKGRGWPADVPQERYAEDGSGWRVLRTVRRGRKLRRGEHAGNAFELCLELEGEATRVAEPAALTRRLAAGVPNYFGPQRFGRDGSNLARARNWIEAGARLPGRGAQRGYVLSAARSLLFNEVVAARVRAGVLDRLLPGDVPDAEDADVATAPLWGRGRSAATSDAAALEATALAPWRAWCDALEHVGLAHERRPVLLRPGSLSVHREASALRLSFTLPPGAFATALLAALGDFRDATTDRSAALGSAA